MDDFLTKKRDSGTVLDLSQATASTKEEFRKLYDRVPEFKIKAEKIRKEDIKIKDQLKEMKFKTTKKEFKMLKEKFTFANPIPPELQSLKINDLAAVPIDWKMLSSIRPKSKVDELFFSRMVQLRKMELKTEAKTKRELAVDSQVKKIKNKAGVIELRPLFCRECEEDFCTGNACKQYTYDCFARVPEATDEIVSKVISMEIRGDKSKQNKTKVKKKQPSKSKTAHKSKTKSKSPTKKRRSKSPKKKRKKPKKKTVQED